MRAFALDPEEISVDHATDIAALGHGGMLGRDMAFRFPSYRARTQE